MSVPDLAPLPFRRPLRLAELDRREETPLALALESEEAAALARFLGVEAVEALAFEGRLAAEGAEGWRLTGQLRARVVQACVVSLEPVRSALGLEVDQRYLATAEAATPSEESDDLPLPADGVLDLAEPLTATLALGLDPYPRAAGAELGHRLAGPPGAEPLTDAAMRPFAGLAALKRKLEGDG